MAPKQRLLFDGRFLWYNELRLGAYFFCLGASILRCQELAKNALLLYLILKLQLLGTTLVLLYALQNTHLEFYFTAIIILQCSPQLLLYLLANQMFFNLVNFCRPLHLYMCTCVNLSNFVS